MANTAEQPRERFTNFTPYEMKKGEDYMSAEMLQHFKDLLLQWKQEQTFLFHVKEVYVQFVKQKLLKVLLKWI